jgi:4-amino-4-deoxy-L-arabinose transferase-like glycosyltransferase
VSSDSQAPAAPEARPRIERAELFALVLVALMTAAALWVRLASLDFALPYQQEPDPHILGQIETLSKPEPSESEIFYSSIYPHLIARTALLFGAEPVQSAPLDAPLEEHLRAASALHLAVRKVVAWLSVLLVPATYWLCRLFQSRGNALLAAAFAATSLLSLQFGQQARPHAAVAPLVGFAVAAAVVLRRRPTTLNFALFGAFFALALGCLTNAAAVVLAFLPALFLREGALGVRRWLEPRALIVVALLALSLRVFWPFLFVDAPPEAAASSGAPEVAPSSGPLLRVVAFGLVLVVGVVGVLVDWLRAQSRPALRWGSAAVLLAGAAGLFTQRHETVHLAWQTIKLEDFSGGGFELLGMTLWFYEPVALVLCALGVLAWFVRPSDDPTRARAKDLLVVLGFALVYGLVIGLFRLNQQRFQMPLLPFLFCGAAFGASELARLLQRVMRTTTERASTAFVAGIALATPLLATWGYAQMRARPHTLEQAAQWLQTNLDRTRERVAIHLLYDVPLVRRESNLFDASGAKRTVYAPWQHYQQRWLREWQGERWDLESLYDDRTRWAWIAKNAEAYVAALDAGYVLCPGENGAGVNPMMEAVRRAVAARGALVARFPQENRPPPSGISGLDTPHFTRFVLSARWFGPELELYRLAGPAPR